MNFFMEGRVSDSPYIDTIWRGRAGSNYAPTCPADGHWNLLFLKQQGKVKVTVEGPLTKATPKTHPEGTEWLVIRFKLGTFLSPLSIKNLVDGDTILPGAASQSFWLHGSTWQLPDYENAETFVKRLVRADLLHRDPLVNTALQSQTQEVSSRTIRRHFLRATGLTPRIIEQIARAQQAAALLEQGISILDVVDQVGYADQPHMTRSLKHFIGQTPAQIARRQRGSNAE
jgi:AraC-like DNA-binding protein